MLTRWNRSPRGKGRGEGRSGVRRGAGRSGVVLGTLSFWTVSVALAAALGQGGAGAPGGPPRQGPQPQRAEIPERYESAFGTHKLLLRAEDRPALDRLRGLGAVERQIDYGSLRLVVVNDRAIGRLREAVLSQAVLRDDFDLVAINRWLIDTRVGEPRDLPWDRMDAPGRYERQLYVVQFVGPAKDEWLADLKGRGDAKVVAYLPHNAYAVYASPQAWSLFSGSAGSLSSPIQWIAPYHPAYRLSAQLEDAIARDDQAVDVVVQVVEHPDAELTASDIKAQAATPLMDDVVLGGLRDVRVRLRAALLPALAALPDVFWIEPCLPKRLMDERQGQIMAGNLDVSGGQPSSPGYLAWLNGKGFTSAFPFTVDVGDDGLDRGSTTDVHQDFRDAGGVSRVAYALNYTSDAAADSGGGHGNINAAIIAGYNDTQGSTAFEDASLYQYGLGIAPYVRVGGSKIFSNSGSFTSTAYSTLIANAYNNGARISSNSWGLTGPGSNLYTSDSRSYDILVRDAVAGTTGNQEMTIVFAAGNAGSAANTVSAPGTGKNVLTVGASENFRQTGTDGCGIGNTGADNARDIISFSSRGPASDGRKKPDLMAAGTHIQGAASRSANYTGAGVCDQYWPAGQTLYAWSSGTSHSTPGAAGAAALARQRFANQGWGTPSPAMTKAFLMATPAYMTGVGANDTLPSNNQGYGRLDLGRAFDGAANIRVDQSQVFGATGQTFTVIGNITNPSQPFRVLLAWSDAPGATSGNAWVNNLDLEATVNGTLFRGNVFSGAGSVSGGIADTRNNTEAVFLPAGTSGSFSITIRATGINGDGVPGNADTTDQDFALFVYNGTQGAPSPDFSIAASPASQTVTQGGSTSYTATVTSLNGFASATTLSVSGLPTGAGGAFAPNPVTPPAGGSAGSTLSVTTAASTPSGTYPLTITGQSGALTHTAGVTLVVQPPGGGNQVLTYAASPGLAIPDNNATGVTSTINVPVSMTITSVSVNVGITHTYQGDLEVSLIGPDNTTVLLHNRTGAGTDNIVTTYNITTRSSQSLAAYNGKNSSGAWRLKVRDLAAIDIGTLNSWKVAFNGYLTAAPALAIPDNNTTGVLSTINVTATGSIADLRVRVNITHTYKGDLEVSLIGPDNTTVLLHNRTGGSTDNVSTVFPDLTVPAQSLAAFAGKPTSGAWKLKVRDLAALDVGTLNSWEIDFRTP